MNFRTLTASVAFMTTIIPASAATLDLSPPPWERWNPPSENNQFAIHAVWNFDMQSERRIAPDNMGVIDSNPLRYKGIGSSATFPDTSMWSDGSWNFDPPGVIDVVLANVVDERPVKFVRAQLTWNWMPNGDTNGVAGNPTFYATSATDSSIDGIIPRSGGSIDNTDWMGTHTFDQSSNRWHSLFLAEIRPNPDHENFEIFIPGHVSIDGLIIDTFSAIPEPSRAMIGLAGLAISLVTHRRRRI